MNERIETEITYTPDDYARSSVYVQKRQFLIKYLYLFVIALFIGILFFNYLANPSKFILAFSQPLNILSILIPLSIIGIWWFFRRNKPNYLMKRSIKSQFNSSPALREPKLVYFDEEGIYAASHLGGGFTKWEAFIEATESKDDLFFFMSNKSAMFTPKRFFNLEQINQIKNLTKRNLGDKARF